MDRRPTTSEIMKECQNFNSFYCLIEENRELFCVDLNSFEERNITGNTNSTGFANFVGNSREKLADYWEYIKCKENFREIRKKYLSQAIKKVEEDVEWMDFDDEEDHCFAGDGIMILVDNKSEHVFPLSENTFILPNLDNMINEGNILFNKFDYFLTSCFWVGIKSEEECHLFGKNPPFHKVVDGRHLRRILCNPHLGQEEILTTIEDSI
ncbi:hypothetical protein DL89DRAFT_271270 [Linderina pennispora]|uniref:Uncharacterized protein n=1 Tax=Linderina pennispora TaxID=61395 RepID=A0A1Y1VV59_9FUNG|nr:uncharacterized protein DL89DRAFT_271270 [Linderina pennispora]ORX65191.1 hypothetical protein DL89DRAFT_271270 [Linderina pennispora]